jgi:5-formyltetrahydrofolate cyclo-ligase
VLAPALAVSLTGVRLGRGGGSYDRALARVPAEVATAAVVFDDEVLDELPTDPWDVRVGWALTPSGWTGMSA